MEVRYIISKVLFWLGLLLCLGGIAVLEYLNFGQAAVWIKEFDRVTAATVIGLVMMAASIVIDWIPSRKRGNMMGEWSVSSQTIDGEEIFQVYRLRNVNGIDHSGNREYCGGIFTDEATARAFADELNKPQKEGS